MGRYRKHMLAICVGLLSVAWSSHQAFANEEILFELGKISFEPLVEFYPPPEASRDKYRLTKEGLEIDQFADQKGKNPWTAGLRTQLMFSGDFKVVLGLDCETEEPRSGWGQGVKLIVKFNDAERTEIGLARYAVPQGGQILQVEHGGPNSDSPVYLSQPCSITSGSLIIERIGSQAIFSISDGTTTNQFETIACPPADVSFIEVICSRQAEGNTRAHYLLKTLNVTADRFFAFDIGRKSWFNLWWLAIIGQFCFLAGLFFWAMRGSKD